jgi:glycosyltransferase involved in cell wall biosynthesis
MNILILNWRDPKNLRSGGAEIVTFKYAQYWQSLGHHVYWITNYYPGANTTGLESNITFIRIKPALGYSILGLLFTYPVFLIRAVISASELMYKIKFDLVIDEIHGLPFFTPIYSNVRTVLLVCEVAGPIWDKMFPLPINIFGRLLEKLIYYLYRNTETWAISSHTKADIYHLNGNKHIKVLPLGIEPIKYPIQSKFSFPSAVFLGRLVKMKGVESAIKAARQIVKILPTFKLYIIGSGSPDYIQNLGSVSCVKFLGRLSDKEKYYYLSKSHFLIHPSYKEGFG